MKRLFLLLALLLVITHFTEAKKQSKELTNDSCVCLTVQAENGSVKLKNTNDGSIAIIIKLVDVVRVSTIILNGEDITNKMEKNVLTIPLPLENTTLEVIFEERPYFTVADYNTIASY